jgi:hypothetical protein
VSDVVEELIPLEDEQEVLAAVVNTNGRCDRCHGRMMFDAEGDSACFTCGNVVYRLPPLPVGEGVLRAPRRRFHGGIDIS